MYFALIGDIIESRKIENRYQVQDILDSFLNELNKIYNNEISAPFQLTIGDEFQAILSKPDKIFEIIEKIEFKMEPVKIRFAIGIGDIITKIDKTTSYKTDGPAWWYARNTIDELKKRHEKGTKALTNIRINGLEKRSIMSLINTSIGLCCIIKDRWTNPQKDIIRFVLDNYGLVNEFVQVEVASKLKLNPVDLNKKLKISRYFDYAKTFNDIVLVLKDIMER